MLTGLPPLVQFTLKLAISIVLGFLVGLERNIRYKDAGVRTHSIVCIGACLMMIVSKYGFMDSADFDASRIASQIVSGIGFLGAGMIFYKRSAVHGLTTAAGVWATAGIGMAVGAGMELIAIIATLLLVLVQFLMHLPLSLFGTKSHYKIDISFASEGNDEVEKIKNIFSVNSFSKLSYTKVESSVICNASIKTDSQVDEAFITKVLLENPFIKSISRSYDNE